MNAKPTLIEAIAERVLLCDGAMGTQLQAVGLEPGACGDAWNIDQPDAVLNVQRAYAEAGADCIITNTFGANRFALARHGLDDKIYTMNKAGAELARRALDGRGYVLGDVGPFGGMLQPFGETSEAELEEVLSEQIRGLLDGGADAILCETQTAIEEAAVGVRAAKALGAPCVVVSFAFDKTGDAYRTMMGVSPADVVARLKDLGVDIYGVNCGTALAMDDYVRIVEQYRAATDAPIMAQPNAGQPTMVEGRTVWLESPDKMAARVPDLIAAGANIIGGCCGTTPEHIRLFRKQPKSF